MAWVDLADNQIPTFADLSTSALNLKSQQVHSTSNQCPTKEQLLIKYWLNQSMLSGYEMNQLPPKIAIKSSGDFGLARLISQQTRNFNFRIDSNSAFQTVAVSGGSCITSTDTWVLNPITTSSINIRITISGANPAETFNWTFRILDDATKTTVYYNTSGVISVGLGVYTTTFTVTGLNPSIPFYYEGIAISTSCPV